MGKFKFEEVFLITAEEIFLLKELYEFYNTYGTEKCLDFGDILAKQTPPYNIYRKAALRLERMDYVTINQANRCFGNPIGRGKLTVAGIRFAQNLFEHGNNH